MYVGKLLHQTAKLLLTPFHRPRSDWSFEFRRSTLRCVFSRVTKLSPPVRARTNSMWPFNVHEGWLCRSLFFLVLCVRYPLCPPVPPPRFQEGREGYEPGRKGDTARSVRLGGAGYGGRGAPSARGHGGCCIFEHRTHTKRSLDACIRIYGGYVERKRDSSRMDSVEASLKTFVDCICISGGMYRCEGG